MCVCIGGRAERRKGEREGERTSSGGIEGGREKEMGGGRGRKSRSVCMRT